jgi:hypothetical protein
MYEQAVQLDIEDEIVKIISEYLKNQLPYDGIEGVLPLILKQFAKEQYHERSYFVLFNELIVKSKDFDGVKEILKTLMSGLMFHLFDMS